MDAESFERVNDSFQQFHAFFAASFGRKQWREHSRNYLQALLVQAGIELSLAVLPEAPALLQPSERPLHHPSFRQHHEGVQFVAFHHFHRGSQQVLHLRSKGLPGVGPVDHHILHPVQLSPALVKHRQSPGPVGDTGGGHVNRMGQPLRVHSDVALGPGHLLARVIALAGKSGESW